MVAVALIAFYIGAQAFSVSPLRHQRGALLGQSNMLLWRRPISCSPTSLFAHHPKMKTIKKIMHRRPKKKRPSDIHRRNVNFGKSINQWPDAPPEYTLRTQEGEKLNKVFIHQIILSSSYR